MGLIGGKFGYRLLKAIHAGNKSSSQSVSAAPAATDVVLFFGDDFFDLIKGKTVIDFGCGAGNFSVEMAQNGAAKVIGIDIRDDQLQHGEKTAARHGVSDCCVFTRATDEPADVIISKDTFEHYEDPAEIPRIMAALIKPDGYVLASFGSTWLHPYGGHLFSVFPWSHLHFHGKSPNPLALGL